jgi:hypothetical protein
VDVVSGATRSSLAYLREVLSSIDRALGVSIFIQVALIVGGCSPVRHHTSIPRSASARRRSRWPSRSREAAPKTSFLST